MSRGKQGAKFAGLSGGVSVGIRHACQPMFTIGSAINQGFKIWARNFMPFTILGMLIYGPLAIWLMLSFHEGMDPQKAMGLAFAVIGLSVVLNLFVTGAVTYGVVMEMRRSASRS